MMIGLTLMIQMRRMRNLINRSLFLKNGAHQITMNLSQGITLKVPSRNLVKILLENITVMLQGMLLRHSLQSHTLNSYSHTLNSYSHLYLDLINLYR